MVDLSKAILPRSTLGFKPIPTRFSLFSSQTRKAYPYQMCGIPHSRPPGLHKWLMCLPLHPWNGVTWVIFRKGTGSWTLLNPVLLVAHSGRTHRQRQASYRFPGLWCRHWQECTLYLTGVLDGSLSCSSSGFAYLLILQLDLGDAIQYYGFHLPLLGRSYFRTSFRSWPYVHDQSFLERGYPWYGYHRQRPTWRPNHKQCYLVSRTRYFTRRQPLRFLIGSWQMLLVVHPSREAGLLASCC